MKNIQNKNYYRILVNDIKEFREPRLMCKFDHASQLSKIFKRNSLRLLALSRLEYIIGPFETFQKLNYENKKQLTTKTLPFHIESIHLSNLYSKSISLHAAQISGMIHDTLNIKQNDMFYTTVSGRMGTGDFNFFIKDISDKRNIKLRYLVHKLKLMQHTKQKMHLFL